uniref:TIR domain-containing protein n=1 Tax=Cyanoderma ruficeps TaxID=181631 RepID=A0A8C3R119_9PASS
MMLCHQLLLVFGLSLATGVCASRSCYSEAQVSMYFFCNLTDVPPVPKDTVKLFLSFSCIKQVTVTSFPLLEHLLLLEIGTQFVGLVTIGKGAFRNLPNLRVLDLGDNKILQLDLDAFVGLPSLTILCLFHNSLGDSILEESYFQDLRSLEELDLSGNKITKLHPHPLFYNLTALKSVNLESNRISNFCQTNLTSFQGKHLLFFNLRSNHLYETEDVAWAKCSNPFKNITFSSLDLSNSGWSTERVQYFCTATKGTQINSLIFSLHIMGSGFGFDNLKNPDYSTFAGLGRSNLKIFDISQGFIFSLNSLIFQSLGNLESLNLFKNKTNQIQRKAFFGLGNLKTLNLSNNLLGELYDYTFEGLHSVTRIDLQQNHIGMIGDKSFRNWLADLGDLYILFQIPDLLYIFLKQNRLSYCVKSANVIENNQLVYMDLGENMLQLAWERDLCLDVFVALPKLQVLHLNNNYLCALPQEIFRGLTSLKILNLASNLLSHLSPGLFPQSLTNLNLSGNQLLSPEPGIFMTLSILDITLYNNVCDCALKSLLVWYCVRPPDFEGVPLSHLTYDGCDEDELQQTLRFSLFIIFSVIVLMLLVTVIIFTPCRGICFVWYKTITKRLIDNQPRVADKSEYKYDAYLCYRKNDFEWVQNSLLKHLDSQYFDENRFTLCFEERDFLPGEEHINNIRDAIWNSRKTICIVTRQFLKDGWCVEAFDFAQSRHFCDLKDVLIMVVVGSLFQYQLKKHKPIRNFLQRSQCLRWPKDYQDVDWFLDNLSCQILKEKKVQRKTSSTELQRIATVSH